MGTSSKELARKLRALAAKQHGCFTAAQAVETGYADSVHLYHVKNGKWIRTFRGVYRFADLPATPEARCMAALLWTRDKNGKIQGYLPSETAEKLRSGTFPTEKPVRVLVPRGFRRSSEAPEGIEIEIIAKKSHKTSKLDGLTVQIDDSRPAERPQRAQRVPGAPLDAPDYYDWLDYQAVLCEKTS